MIKDIIKKYLLYFLGKYILSDERLIRLRGNLRLKRKINLDNPVYFNDKINWLKLNWYDPTAKICADKYAVRNYIQEKIGVDYLNTLYGVYDDVDKIDLSKLPNSFVLKSTHGTGEVIIVKDKNNINWTIKKKVMRKWLKRNIYWTTREWVYKDIKPQIICEKLLVDKELEDLRDYKIYCFNGEPKLIQVHMNRFNDHKRQIYDINWNLTDIKINYNTVLDKKIKKPKKLDEMLRLSEKLSEAFPFVRVDFYIVNGQIIFGELTFFPGAGFLIFEDLKKEELIGSWLELPNNKREIV